MTTIAANLDGVQAQIAAACARAGRSTSAVTLIAVSKTHPVERVLEAAAAGLQHFGENRVEEAESKIAAARAQTRLPLTWHMIGHIQSRKAKTVAPLFDVAQSVDSLKLANKLAAAAGESGKTLDVLLEMNVSGEEAKDGFPAARWQQDAALRAQLWAEVQQIAALPGLRLRGLMTMAPIVEDAEQVRPVFASLAALRTALAESLRLDMPELSMGMSDDFAVAIEEGATMVRIGRAIFGEREK
ncbi:MAG: YggS family pyridoxal phosphate-dependent enzyme [Anaerolineae bacterium]|nr:YggS family pyridoxal phosphate-dependent enzyme [Anaerolineae bacterium]